MKGKEGLWLWEGKISLCNSNKSGKHATSSNIPNIHEPPKNITQGI